MAQVQQNHMAFPGCEDPKQQGYETYLTSPTFDIAHTFNAPVKGYIWHNGYNHDSGTTGIDNWTSADALASALGSHGILGYVFVFPTTNSRTLHTSHMGDMTRPLLKHEIVLLRAQTDPTHNGLYVAQGYHALSGIWAGAWQLTLMRLDPNSHTSATFDGDAHFTADGTQIQGLWPGVHLESTAALVDAAGTEPTINADGNLVFAVGWVNSPFLSTQASIGVWQTDLKNKTDSPQRRTGEDIDTETVDRFIKLQHNTDPAVNRLWKIPAGAWGTAHNITWYPVEEGDVKFVKMVGNELHVSGGKSYDVTDPNSSMDSVAAVFGSTVAGMAIDTTGSNVVKVTGQTDPHMNGYFRYDEDGNSDTGGPAWTAAAPPGAVAGVGGYFAYRRFRKLPYFTYASAANSCDVSCNVRSPQGEYTAMVSRPSATDGSQYAWSAGGGAPFLWPIASMPTVHATHIIYSTFTGVDGKIHYARGRIADGTLDRLEYYMSGGHPLATMTTAANATMLQAHSSGGTLVVGDVCLIGYSATMTNDDTMPVPVTFRRGIWVYAGTEGDGTAYHRRVFTRHTTFTGDVFAAWLTLAAAPGGSLQIATPLGYNSQTDAFPMYRSAQGIQNAYEKDPVIHYAPATSSGRIIGKYDIHAEQAEVHSVVFYAARNCNMTHYNELVIRGLKLQIDDMFHRLSMPVGGGSRHTQKPGVVVPIEFNRQFTRVHRTSLMFDTLDLKQVMEYNFVYADTGDALSDEHARTVGRVYLTMNYKGFFM